MQHDFHRLLVTGGNGFVAGSIIKQAPADCELHVLTRGEARPAWGRAHSHRFESGNAAGLAEVFKVVRPQGVIHTAALANIDYCEAHPEEAETVNVELTRVLAHLCSVHKAKFVFCSTDTIFDGEHAPYHEEAASRPLNCYARTKVAAENAVRESGGRTVIARLALVLGLPMLGARDSFLTKWVSTLRTTGRLEVPAREVRTPVDVITLGRALLELATGDFEGTVHLAGNDSLTRLDLAKRVASRFGFAPTSVVPMDPSGLPGRAARPRDVSLDNRRARTSVRTPMLDLEDALTLILQNSTESP